MRPISSFDLNDNNQALLAFNWRNIRPEWQEANRKKWFHYAESDEKKWVQMMRSLAFDGDLFLKYQN